MSKPDTSKDVKIVYSNIFVISFTCCVLKCLTFKEVNARHPSNSLDIFCTLFVSNLDISRTFKLVQSWNIFDISITFPVLNSDKSNEVKERQLSNKPAIFSTFSVLIAPKFIFSNKAHS